MPSIDSESAHVLLANLGFLLVPGPPLDHGAAYLLVAVRPRPTLAHFDPERITYWTLPSGHAVEAEITWPFPTTDQRFAWGEISVGDRHGAVNKFISFGGELSVSRDKDVQAALFRSEAPILSMGGHSVGTDALAAQVAGFQAQLQGAAGYDSPVRDLAERLSPNALYSAFVTRSLDMYRNPDAAGTVSGHLVSLLRAERRRLEAQSRGDFEASEELTALLVSQNDFDPAPRKAVRPVV